MRSDRADTRTEELCVAFAAVISAAMFSPVVGAIALVALTATCVVTARFAVRLVAEPEPSVIAGDLITLPDVEPELPRIEPELPRRLFERQANGDELAGSYLRILARLYPSDAGLIAHARLADAGVAGGRSTS